MRYNFPKTWRTNLTHGDELADSLHRDAKWLKQFESKIPNQYHNVPLKKKNGDTRWLSVPGDELKEVQRSILANLLTFSFPNYVQGGAQKRSIVTNASLHRKKKWVACLDISKFFPNVHHSQLNEVFLDLGNSKEVASSLTHFTSYDYELPQGAPTSPTLANLILYNLDISIQRLCEIKQFTYSRYFDDITISGNRPLDTTCDKVIAIARREGFKIHKDDEQKFRKTPTWKTQIVTGIIVNRKRLEPSDTFLADFQKTLESLEIGDLPAFAFYKTLTTARGMVAFLNSVNPSLAHSFQRKIDAIDWEKYGLS